MNYDYTPMPASYTARLSILLADCGVNCIEGIMNKTADDILKKMKYLLKVSQKTSGFLQDGVFNKVKSEAYGYEMCLKQIIDWIEKDEGKV